MHSEYLHVNLIQINLLYNIGRNLRKVRNKTSTTNGLKECIYIKNVL